jgi:hypothetical protein
MDDAALVGVFQPVGNLFGVGKASSSGKGDARDPSPPAPLPRGWLYPTLKTVGHGPALTP